MAESNSQRVAKNTIYMFFRMVMVLIVTLYTSRVIIHTLGVDDFGIYNVVGSVVVLFGFLQTALTSATYRYIAFDLGKQDFEGLKKTYSMALYSHIILALILVLVVEIAGILLLEYKLNIPDDRRWAAKIAFHFSVLTFAISIIKTPFNSNVVAHEKMNFYAIVSIIEVVLKLGVAYCISISTYDKLITYSGLLTLVSILLLLSYIIYCKIIFKDTKIIKYWDSNLVKRFTSYSGWSIVVNGADVSSQQAISIFLNMFIGVTANAALGIAQQVNAGINSFLSSFTQAFNPQIIKSYAAEKYDYFMKLLFSTSKISYILILLIASPIVCNIEFILNVWLGEGYPTMTPSFIRVMIIYWFVDAFQYPLWQAVYATGKLKTHQLIIGSIKILAIPISYIVLKYGGGGSLVLLFWSLLNVICAVARTLYMKYLISLDIKRYVNDVVLKLVVLTLIVLPLTIFVSYKLGSNLKSFLFSSVISVVMTLGVGVLVVLNEEERGLLKRLPLISKLYNNKESKE